MTFVNVFFQKMLYLVHFLLASTKADVPVASFFGKNTTARKKHFPRAFSFPFRPISEGKNDFR